MKVYTALLSRHTDDALASRLTAYNGWQPGQLLRRRATMSHCGLSEATEATLASLRKAAKTRSVASRGSRRLAGLVILLYLRSSERKERSTLAAMAVLDAIRGQS